MKLRTYLSSRNLTLSTRAMLTLIAAVAFNPAIGLAEDLPSRDEIIAKMIEAEGGAAAKRRIKNRVVTLTLDLGIGGMIAKGLAYAARPGNMHTTLEIEGLGTIEEGVTHGVAWGLSMMTGPQIKEGGEREMALREADFDGLSDWKKFFKKIECVSKEELDGKSYFKVEFTPNEGGVITSYVDAKTYLPYRSDLTLSTAMGEFEMQIYADDYRAVDGVQYAHRTRIEIMGQTRIVTIESIKHNIDMPKDRFKLPDDIKAVITKRKGETGKP